MSQYNLLAPIYETIGLSSFASNITPQILAFSQRNDWLGRHILDLGCGTGVTTRWFAPKGYSITAIDQSTEMLAEAARRFDARGFGVEWKQGDIRTLPPMGEHYDLALALDVMNELSNLRDLEAVFQGVWQALGSGKWFIFDLHTVQGLMEYSTSPVEVWMNNDELFVMANHQADFDRQTLASLITVFRRNGQAYVRNTAERTLRGFPLQAVVALLGRANFGIMGIFSLQFETVDPANVRESRVLVIARKLETP